MFSEYGEFYLKEAIFTADYVFKEVADERGDKYKYRIPANPMVEMIKYHDYITTVPVIDHPEVFGLHSNADLTFRLKESVEMINTIMETRPKESGGGTGKTREEIVQEKAKELLGKLPGAYVDAEMKE